MKTSLRPLPVVAIVGRPNVGKSTLFNRLIGANRATLSEIPGTTRDVLFGEVKWERSRFIIADTAGFEFDNKSELSENVLTQTKMAIKSSDFILFMVNAKEGLTIDDEEANALLRKSGKPVIVLINKTDSKLGSDQASEFYKLGQKTMFETSATSGKGTGDMLDILIKQLKTIKSTRNLEPDIPTIKVAILGRPNVGKSTLFNKLIGKNRSVVSNVAGTTRDAVNDTILHNNHVIEFVDTAGLRRRGKVEGIIEKFSALQVIRATQQADVCLLVMEGHEGVSAQDMHILQIILESQKSPILVINKWDLVNKTASITAEYEKYLSQKYKFADWMYHHYLSALTGLKVDKIKDLIVATSVHRNFVFPAAGLRDVVSASQAKLKPKGSGRPTYIHSVRQVAVNPPTLQLTVSRGDRLHFTYLRYLENQIRNTWDLSGTPIVIKVQEYIGKALGGATKVDRIKPL